MAERLTVLQLLPGLHGGGVERGVLEVAQALVQRGHRSLVVSKGGPMVEALEAAGSEHWTCPIGRKSPTTLFYVPWLRNLMLEQRVDVVDYHSRLPGWVALAALRTITPGQRPVCVSSLHGLHRVNPYSGVMCRGDAVVVVSETLKRYAIDNYRYVQEDRTHVIYRGLDDREFPRHFQLSEPWVDAFREQFPATRNRRLVAIVGRLTRLKGHADFLQLIADLRKSDPSIHGLIVGGAQKGKGAYRDELVRQTARMGLEPHVTFCGSRSDLKEIYRHADLVVSLSRTPESFGRTVAESLAIGTPVVGYDHGGVAEILAAEFPQGAVRAGDQSGLLVASQRVLNASPPPTILPNQYRLDTMQRETIELYEQLANQRAAGGSSNSPAKRSAAA